MSRALLGLALAAAIVLGIAPIAVMATRVSAADLAAIAEPRTLALLGRTLLVGGGAALIALVVGLPVGFLAARTNVWGRPLLRALVLVPLCLPPLMLAMSWCVLVPMRGGSMIVLLLGAANFPLVALFAGRAFERVDARREEAALLAGGLSAVVRMELPLILPAALAGTALAFVFAIHDFALPDYVSSVGVKFNVYADEIFASWQIDHADGKAVATAIPLVALTLLALLPALVLRRRGSLATIGTDFQSPAELALGRARAPASILAWTVVVLTAGVPLGRLAWEAGGGAQGWELATVSASFARAIELAGDNLSASLGFGVAAASLVVPLALVLGHATERARLGRALEWLAVLPLAVPAVLFAIGEIALYNNAVTADFYASPLLVVLMLAGRFLAFPILIVSGAVASLDQRLEEAARLAGAGPGRRLVSNVTPGVWPALLGGWMLVFVFAVRELDSAILVPAANQAVMIRVYNAVHFGRDDFVAALALLVVFVIVLPGIVWALFGGRRLQVLP